MTCQPAREGMGGREGETLRREWAVVRVKVARGQLADRPTAHTLSAADMMRPSPGPGSRDYTLTPPLVQW